MTQGELYWLRFGAEGSEPSGRRPAMVIQHDRFNRSAIQTTIVAAVTSNLKLAGVPGNVRLKKGEARELDYCTSYSHRGRFYTLRELADAADELRQRLGSYSCPDP